MEDIPDNWLSDSSQSSRSVSPLPASESDEEWPLEELERRAFSQDVNMQQDDSQDYFDASESNAIASNASASNASASNARASNASASNASAQNASASNASAQNASASNATASNASAQNASAFNARASNASAFKDGLTSRVRQGSDGQWSATAPKVSNVQDLEALGIRATEKDMQRGAVKNGTPIGLARAIGIERKRQRSQLLDDLKHGKITLQQLIDMTINKSDPNMLAASKIRVKSLINNLPHTGKTKMTQVFAETSIDPKMTLSQLCQPQNRQVLTKLLQSVLDRIPSLRVPSALGIQVTPVE